MAWIRPAVKPRSGQLVDVVERRRRACAGHGHARCRLCACVAVRVREGCRCVMLCASAARIPTPPARRLRTARRQSSREGKHTHQKYRGFGGAAGSATLNPFPPARGPRGGNHPAPAPLAPTIPAQRGRRRGTRSDSPRNRHHTHTHTCHRRSRLNSGDARADASSRIGRRAADWAAKGEVPRTQFANGCSQARS